MLFSLLLVGPDQSKKVTWKRKGRGDLRNLSSKVNNSSSSKIIKSYQLHTSPKFPFHLKELVTCFKEGLIIHSWHYAAIHIFLACTEHPISLGMLLSPGFSVVRSAINLIWTPGSLVLLSSLFLHWISQATHIQSP